MLIFAAAFMTYSGLVLSSWNSLVFMMECTWENWTVLKPSFAVERWS